MSADSHLLLLCAECGDERRFEQPPCADGHGADCPEWACVDCGSAILIGPAPSAEPVRVGAGPDGAAEFAGSWSASHPAEGRRQDVRHRYVA